MCYNLVTCHIYLRKLSSDLHVFQLTPPGREEREKGKERLELADLGRFVVVCLFFHTFPEKTLSKSTWFDMRLTVYK